MEKHTRISNLEIVRVSGSSGGVADKTEAHIHVRCDGGTVDEICRMLKTAPDLLAERDRLRVELDHAGEAMKLVSDQADAWRVERDRLKSANAELVAALEEIERMTEGRSGTLTKATLEVSRAALARAKE